MKGTFGRLAAIAAILSLGTFSARAKVDPTLTPDEARAIAQDAWVFGLPLVYFEKQIDAASHVTKPQGPLAPINQFAHYREFPDASNRTAAGLDFDTLRSYAAVDLSQGPLVLSIPEMGDRYWIVQLIDAWNNVPHAPGSRTIGGKGGTFAIVGPGWRGKLPAGLTELRVPTSLVMIAGRTYAANKDDYPAVQALQDKYRLVPLSKWGKAYPPPDNVPLKLGVDTQTPVEAQMLGMSPEVFFNRLNALLVANPPEPPDPKIMTRMARLGIVPGASFSIGAFSLDVRHAIEEGVAAGQQLIRETRRGKEVNGWNITLDMGRYGTNYPYRASWAFFGFGGNRAEDAVFPFASKDGAGELLHGCNKYVLHFDKGELPPVDGFWSLTVYDGDSYLVPNPLNRHALGNRSGLKLGDDGSLTIYMQPDAPGADREANWLPVAPGAFRVALRLYAPRKEVVDGRWSPPPIRRVREIPES